MIKFREAVSIALMRNEKYDHFKEYNKVYIFSIADAEDTIGGFDNHVYIIKEDGEIVSFASITLEHHYDWLCDKELIREGNIFNRLKELEDEGKQIDEQDKILA